MIIHICDHAKCVLFSDCNFLQFLEAPNCMDFMSRDAPESHESTGFEGKKSVKSSR